MVHGASSILSANFDCPVAPLLLATTHDNCFIAMSINYYSKNFIDKWWLLITIYDIQRTHWTINISPAPSYKHMPTFSTEPFKIRDCRKLTITDKHDIDTTRVHLPGTNPRLTILWIRSLFFVIYLNCDICFDWLESMLIRSNHFSSGLLLNVVNRRILSVSPC